MKYDGREPKAPAVTPGANGEGRRMSPLARRRYTSLDRYYCHCGNPQFSESLAARCARTVL